MVGSGVGVSVGAGVAVSSGVISGVGVAVGTSSDVTSGVLATVASGLSEVSSVMTIVLVCAALSGVKGVAAIKNKSGTRSGTHRAIVAFLRIRFQINGKRDTPAKVTHKPNGTEADRFPSPPMISTTAKRYRRMWNVFLRCIVILPCEYNILLYYA